jgi:CO dehydrogenase/acetyl-CoA synthase epsilon subunit
MLIMIVGREALRSKVSERVEKIAPHNALANHRFVRDGRR